jgi:repressor of nif and glnA expression
MSTYLLTRREEVEEHRRRINTIRSAIEYDIVNHPLNTEFEELEVLLNDAVHKLDEIHDKMKEHVYVFDVTITVSRCVNVKARDEDDAEQAAMDYAVEELSAPIDWNEDGVEAMRDEDEETTKVYDVEV